MLKKCDDLHRHRNAAFSARPSRRAQPFSACARAKNAPSRSKRLRFTEEEDAKVSKFKAGGLVVGGHSTFLSREERRVAASAVFYKVEGEMHCVIRKAILDN